jgi:glyoxylase-like metal-dependent hydrolase (beta-lactamase superfamily II)
MSMKVIHQISGPIGNNTYLAFDDNKNCIIIDAPFEAYNAINPAIEKYGLNNPQYIFVTHTH